jgi:[acyl-carrier-protein] S-malonyltransferase
MVLDAVERLGVEPSICAGHSLGEYTALTANGALGFDDGVRLVVERGDAMHEAGQTSPGAMSAVLGLDDDLVEVACRRADDSVWVATQHAKELGAKKVMPLPVSGAFHTPLMNPARDRLRVALAAAKPRDADVPIVSNVDALLHQRGDEWISLLSAQLCSPVRWKHVLLELQKQSIAGYVELGPGGVLSGMVKRTLEGARSISVATPDELDKLLEWVSQVTPPKSNDHDGEHLFVVERLVVSPAAGVFVQRKEVADGSRIEVGTVLGHIGDVEVRSPFAGILQNFIAHEGERLTMREPVAWLRTH